MQLADLKIKDVYPSITNTRTDYNGQDMAELVKSIDAVGLLNPIIVRKAAEQRGTDTYEVIAGHRRLYALKNLGRETIPARVLEATDDGALQMQIIENLHRKDLNPIEEAKAFRHLADTARLDAGGIAAMADKSVAYVTRALTLLTLKEKTQFLIAGGHLSAAHGHQIARVEGKQRDTIEAFANTNMSWPKRLPTLAELRDHIDKTVARDLSQAVFPKDVANYGGTATPACTACPWNSGNQNVLFDGATKGSCTNPTCFTKRTNHAYKEMREKVETENPNLKFIGFAVSSGYNNQAEVKGFPIIDMAKRGKDMRAHPEKYGFAIMKPNRYDPKSKPSVLVVSLDKKEKPAAMTGDRDWEKERFVEQHVTAALKAVALKRVRTIEKRHLIQMLREQVADPGQLPKLSFPRLLVALWLAWLGDYNVAEKLNALGIETASVIKAAKEEAAELYAAEKEKTK